MNSGNLGQSRISVNTLRTDRLEGPPDWAVSVRVGLLLPVTTGRDRPNGVASD